MLLDTSGLLCYHHRDERQHANAVTFFRTYSLCDAVSFVLMQHYGITEALTTDHHFEQEGFVRLLEP